MTRHRYTVYDTDRHEYLRCMTLPAGDERGIVTHWTREVENAMKFPGVKSAQRMLNSLGNYSQFIIKNERGDVVG